MCYVIHRQGWLEFAFCLDDFDFEIRQPNLQISSVLLCSFIESHVMRDIASGLFGVAVSPVR